MSSALQHEREYCHYHTSWLLHDTYNNIVFIVSYIMYKSSGIHTGMVITYVLNSSQSSLVMASYIVQLNLELKPETIIIITMYVHNSDVNNIGSPTEFVLYYCHDTYDTTIISTCKL